MKNQGYLCNIKGGSKKEKNLRISAFAYFELFTIARRTKQEFESTNNYSP